jgi:hypothetical protein
MVLATYAAPDLLPGGAGPWVQYIMRGVLGCALAAMLWRGMRISGACVSIALLWEGAASICGLLWWRSEPDARALCDAGAGAPLTLLALAVSVLLLLRTHHGR